MGSVLPLHAAELFGVVLQDAKRDQLRNALKNSGVELIREGGEGIFFDVYDSQQAMAGSQQLYLGFVKQDQTFAFAEYAFKGRKQSLLLQKLIARYGEPQQKPGKFLSDHAYFWQSGPITIELYNDWHNYQTRLTYFAADKLDQLRREQSDYRKQLSLQNVDFADQAY